MRLGKFAIAPTTVANVLGLIAVLAVGRQSCNGAKVADKSPLPPKTQAAQAKPESRLASRERTHSVFDSE